MDWWDSVPLNQYISNEANLTDNYEVVCVPAMHWSGRYIFDSNTTLWCSYIIKRNGEALLYHAGDTGYLKELFKIIGAKVLSNKFVFIAYRTILSVMASETSDIFRHKSHYKSVNASLQNS